MFCIVILALVKHSSITKVMFFTCSLLAISGTTPPNDEWIAICDDITVAISSQPFFTIEQLVSSQLLSIPNI